MKMQTLSVCLLKTYGKSLNQVPTQSQRKQTPYSPATSCLLLWRPFLLLTRSLWCLVLSLWNKHYLSLSPWSPLFVTSYPQEVSGWEPGAHGLASLPQQLLATSMTHH